MTKERFEGVETLVKRATNTKYYNLISDEYKWYSELGFNNELCPKIYTKETTMDNNIVGFRMKFFTEKTKKTSSLEESNSKMASITQGTMQTNSKG